MPPEAPQVVDTNSYQQEVYEGAFAPAFEDVSQNESSQQHQKSQQELNFEALRGEISLLKAEKDRERSEHQQQLDILRANVAQQHQPKQPERQMFDGMSDDDIPSVKDIRSAWQEKEMLYQARIEELQLAQQHPDYAEVIEKYALPLVKQKPHLAEGFNGASNKALYAYELGKMAQQMQQASQTPAPQNENARRMVENSRKPGTLSQAAGGQTVLSQADHFATMSDAEFHKLYQRNIGER